MLARRGWLGGCPPIELSLTWACTRSAEDSAIYWTTHRPILIMLLLASIPRGTLAAPLDSESAASELAVLPARGRELNHEWAARDESNRSASRRCSLNARSLTPVPSLAAHTLATSGAHPSLRLPSSWPCPAARSSPSRGCSSTRTLPSSPATSAARAAAAPTSSGRTAAGPTGMIYVTRSSQRSTRPITCISSSKTLA